MSKFTPGPWRACHNGKCQCHMVWSIPADCVVAVAVSAEHEALTGGEGITNSGMLEANTRLIAAAPLLAEALQGVHSDIFDMLDLDFDPHTLRKDRWARRLDLIAAALKAAGLAEAPTPAELAALGIEEA